MFGDSEKAAPSAVEDYRRRIALHAAGTLVEWLTIFTDTRSLPRSSQSPLHATGANASVAGIMKTIRPDAILTSNRVCCLRPVPSFNLKVH